MNDVIIIGSGPAGVSAAFPLLEGGRQVLMIDGGKSPRVRPPVNEYLVARTSDSQQSRWMVGAEYQALTIQDRLSPKMRVPTQAFAFDGFQSANKIVSNGVVALGSLATGGLSNVWGCGVAAYAEEAFLKFPFEMSDIEQSYRDIATRIGISGSLTQDDLSQYFGLDKWTNGHIPLDRLHESILESYQLRRSQLHNMGVKLGVARKAVLSENRGKEKGCNLCGNCLFGCERQSLYSSIRELGSLMSMPHFDHQAGIVVEKIEQVERGWKVYVLDAVKEVRKTLDCKVLVMAAGTLASTRLIFDSISYQKPARLLSTPTAAFLLLKPKFLGYKTQSGFGLGQLSYTVNLPDKITGFGSLFSPVGIPMSEFVRQIPFQSKMSIKIMQSVMSSSSIGNVFLPGDLSNIFVQLNSRRQLVIDGSYSSETDILQSIVKERLTSAFLKLGVLLVPGSFTLGPVGGGVHYAGTVPMKLDPQLGESSKFGQPTGTTNLFLVDGASLPYLSEQSHTLTIMANADRIAKHLVARVVPY